MKQVKGSLHIGDIKPTKQIKRILADLIKVGELFVVDTYPHWWTVEKEEFDKSKIGIVKELIFQDKKQTNHMVADLQDDKAVTKEGYYKQWRLLEIHFADSQGQSQTSYCVHVMNWLI